MPQFMLNRSPYVNGEPGKAGKVHPFYSLDTFAKGYVEAMFFTNGDTGDERENLLNDWGVERLTRSAVDSIRAYCARFVANNEAALSEAYGREDYSEEQAGRDLWFTAQGHGVGFWDRKQLEGDGLDGRLTEAARKMGESYVEAYRGWIYHR
jgi:hypothetical protein